MAVDVTLHRRSDRRAVSYALAVGSATILGLFTGQIALAAFAAVFATALLSARPAADTLTISVDLELDRTRLIEGDELAVAVRVEAPAGDERALIGTTAEFLTTASDDLVVEPDAGTFGAAAAVPLGVDTALRTRRWGRFVIGPTHLRLRHPWSIDWWEATLDAGPVAIVLPTAVRLDTLLEPRSSRTTAGAHRSRRSLGAGLDFAELQQYQPGDRLRDLNRAASARTRTPIVNRYHPDRAGEVVIVLDTLLDAALELSNSTRRALITEARAAWAVAQAHLAAHDRVGIATVGRIPVWLTPQAGARARFAILEALLSVGAVLDHRTALGDALDAGKISPAALVVFVTPLWSDAYVVNVERLAARGREPVVIRIATDAMVDLADAAPASAEHLAGRLFQLDADDRAATLRRAGITVVDWHPERRLGSALTVAATLQRRRRSAHRGRK